MSGRKKKQKDKLQPKISNYFGNLQRNNTAVTLPDIMNRPVTPSPIEQTYNDASAASTSMTLPDDFHSTPLITILQSEDNEVASTSTFSIDRPTDTEDVPMSSTQILEEPTTPLTSNTPPRVSSTDGRKFQSY